tara:strand:- start:827 stop:1459 length:633 start_codon:yes stop_codon:yes gene_type:complete
MQITEQKRVLLTNTFINLLIQLFIMYISIVLVSNNQDVYEFVNSNLLWVILVYFVLVFTLALARFRMYFNLSIPIRFTIFALISVISGVLLSNVRNIEYILLDVFVIFLALVGAGILSVQMNMDLSFIGGILSLILSAILIYRIVNLLNNTENQYSEIIGNIIGIVFALFVIVDTNSILQNDYEGNFLNASFNYFTDVLQLIKFMDNDNN